MLVGKKNDGVRAGPAVAATSASHRFTKLFWADKLIS